MMPSDSCPSAVPPVLSHQTWRAVTGRPCARLPWATVVVRTSRAMPNPLWRTNARPLCSLIGLLTLHKWPGIVTLPQFTLCALCALRVCADAARADAACAAPSVAVKAVAVRAVTAASDDTMSLMFFTGPLPWMLGDLLWRQRASVEKEARGTEKI